MPCRHFKPETNWVSSSDQWVGHGPVGWWSSAPASGSSGSGWADCSDSGVSRRSDSSEAEWRMTAAVWGMSHLRTVEATRRSLTVPSRSSYLQGDDEGSESDNTGESEGKERRRKVKVKSDWREMMDEWRNEQREQICFYMVSLTDLTETRFLIQFWDTTGVQRQNFSLLKPRLCLRHSHLLSSQPRA